jgi:hypothetical protein
MVDSEIGYLETKILISTPVYIQQSAQHCAQEHERARFSEQDNPSFKNDRHKEVIKSIPFISFISNSKHLHNGPSYFDVSKLAEELYLWRHFDR